MKCVFISCFDNYDNRIKPIEAFLCQRGYECEYITSDFDHVKKIKYKTNREGSIQIEAIPYFKNLSVRRLLSHYFFAKKALEITGSIKPDLMYIMVPPNSLVMFASKYKRKNDVKLVYDLYDLWPETFPSSKSKKLLSVPFAAWRNLRDNWLKYADFIITECDLYQEVLKTQLSGINTATLYFGREKLGASTPDIDSHSVNICYLGSINNLIDISLINSLLAEINMIKPVTLHIIGDGEKRDKFIETLADSNIKVNFHGKIFDADKKREIFDKCSFGLNIMKDTVCVGLTLKSIDYFQAGLPILNNIKADTANLVDKYNIGINISEGNLKEAASQIAAFDNDELMAMRTNTLNAFERYFSTEALTRTLGKVFSKLETK